MGAVIDVSLVLQPLANEIEATLRHAAGERVSFILVAAPENTAQYVANIKREFGIELLQGLLGRWQAGMAAIPAHYNPAIKGAAGVLEAAMEFVNRNKDETDIAFAMKKAYIEGAAFGVTTIVK